MSTVNSSNLDNDPFPVFTPRNLLQVQQQQQQQQQQSQIGRTPLQHLSATAPSYHPVSSSNVASSLQNLLNMQQQQQQSPSTASPFGRYGTPSTNGSGNTASSASANAILNLMRSPSNSMTSSAPTQQQSRQNQLLTNMVQNLGLNPQTSSLSAQNTPLISAVGKTTSITPPPTGGLHHHQHSHHHTGAHRKLFPIDNNQMNPGNDMMLLGSSGSGDFSGVVAPPPPTEQLMLPEYASRVAPPDLAHVAYLKPSDSYFMSDELKSELIRKNMIMQALPIQELAIQLPSQVKDYHNLIPLDSQQVNIDHKSRTYNGYQTISYRATHIKTNCIFYLKRIINFRYTNQRFMDIVEAWKKLQTANVVTLREVFGTKDFGDHSTIFVYDYYPGLETLQYKLYNNPNLNLKGWANPYNLDGSARPFSAGKGVNTSRSLGLLPEQNVWDYVIQLASILRAVHGANLSCRILSPIRLLVDNRQRLRLSGVGIFDVIDYENSINNVAQYQQDDLTEFGRLVLALACNSLVAIQKEHLATSVDIISKNYSPDLKNLILHFINNNRATPKSLNDIVQSIGTRFFQSIDNALIRGDIMENELSKEIENGRLFRLICKLNIVLDRVDDLQWSETGDRYMLKLFRDYVFHQVTPNGNPWVDMSHFVQCLNRFDSGSNDKICLISQDGQNIMIVTYAQLKKCFDKVFNELTSMVNV